MQDEHPQPGAAEALRKELDERLAARDRAGAVTTIVQAVADGRIDIIALYQEVLAPLMVDTGAAWQSGEIKVWEEHFASATVRTIIDALYPEVVRLAQAGESRSSAAGTVLLACPPEEEHDLGLRMLADRFEIAGWKTYFLGADTPVDQIADASNTFGVDLIVLSAATHFHRIRMRHVIDELRETVGDARIVVGGAAFDTNRDAWPAEELFDPAIIAAGSGA